VARDLIGYGNQYPAVRWPGEARIAVSTVIHFEEGAESTPWNGDPRVENGTEGVFVDQVAQAEGGRRDERVESIYEYGPRCGYWRLAGLLDAYEVKATFFCAGQALERSPEVARDIPARGHEVCGHGYRWLPYHLLTPEEERADIRRAVEAIEKATGQRPLGWHSRSPTPHTRGFLIDEGGFLYDSDSYGDDLPYTVPVGGSEILTVPYNVDANDDKFWALPPVAGFTSPDDFFAVMAGTFDRLYAEGETHPRMMSVGLHLRISGRPGRARQIERFIRYARGFPRVWFARRVDIARWWLAHCAEWERLG
jgi:peptidoglycan/xylan/chitin deacetylase (PgdA/CDA1 family)